MDSLWFEWARNVTADARPVQWGGGPAWQAGARPRQMDHEDTKGTKKSKVLSPPRVAAKGVAEIRKAFVSFVPSW